MDGQTLAVNEELFSPDFIRDPYSIQARLRAQAPVHRALTPNSRFPVWVISRYSDVRAALADPRLSKDSEGLRKVITSYFERAGRPVEFSLLLGPNMLNSDPPQHTRLRSLVSKAFTTHRVASLRPRVEEIADELLDEMSGRAEVDLLDAFAFPLPITVICELLGIPVADRTQFRNWTKRMLTGANDTDTIAAASLALGDYLHELIDAKRAAPADDLLSALIQARDEGDRLSEEELLSTVGLLLVAGHETTINLIGNGALALLKNPAQRAKLLADHSLLPSAVEEFLRFDSPIHIATHRFTAEPVEIGGTVIPQGELVFISLGSANQDPERFENPDRLDLSRPIGGHVSFGHGVHYCLGAPLARLEGEVAFGRMLGRFPRMRLAVEADQLRWRPTLLFRGLETLPVVLDG